MSIAYFDCFSGIAGDMVLGAFIDAGMPVAHLKKELKKVGLKKYKIKVKSGAVHGFRGTNLHVEVAKNAGSESYTNIKKMITKSRLSPRVKKISLEIFSHLASAEAKVHGKSVKNIHFHEVAFIDSVVDIIGAAIGAEYFKFEKIFCSPLPVTRGYVKCAHGRLPVPAPATLEMLKGLPVEPSPIKDEIVTPTGVAIIKTLACGFGSSPLRKIDKVGYGFGDKEYPGNINALRLFVGEGAPLTVVEANIDDMNPEIFPYVIEKLLSSGAIDAGLVPMIMKKGRPGVLLHALVEGRDRKKIIKIILGETTTFGVRYFPVEREMTEREIKKIKTKWGGVRVKMAKYDGKTITISPEYSDCEKLAKKKKVPIKDIYRQAIFKSM
jgi:hypothetical protein